MSSVYIAAPFPLQDRAGHLRAALKLRANIACSSRWLDEPPNGQLTDALARMDLEDVMTSDALVMLNPDGWEQKGTGGRWVEFGYAVAMAKPILVVGERSNIFCHLSHVHQVDELADVVKAVQKLLVREDVG